MSPIKNLTEVRRLPRLGRIRTGVKVTNAKGTEYPQAVDYFVVPQEVQEVYGEKPKSLRIYFPVEDPEIFASQFYRAYSASRGLICKGDGAAAYRLCDINNDSFPTPDSKETALKEVACEGKDCEFYGKKCTEVMNLQFLLPDVPGLGVWQLDTGSINAIKNVNSTLELIRSIIGRVAMVPLDLVIAPLEVTADGKKKTVHIINIKLNKTLLELRASMGKELPRLAPVDKETGEINPGLPVPDDEIPELIMPQNQEANDQVKVEHKAEVKVEPEVKTESNLNLTDVLNVDWSKETQKDYLNMLVKVSIKLGWLPPQTKKFFTDNFKIADSRGITIGMRQPILKAMIAELQKDAPLFEEIEI